MGDAEFSQSALTSGGSTGILPKRQMKSRAYSTPPVTPSTVTELLAAWSHGDRTAFDQLIPLVIEELRRLARRQLARERPGHTLQSTELINEVYLRWSKQASFDWRDRAHFFSFAAAQMRHILVEHARKKNAEKRGHGQTPIRLTNIDELEDVAAGHKVDLIDLDRALNRLSAMDPQYSRIVELRYFAGLSVREVAEALEVTERTVLRRWAWIKAWLFRQLDARSPRRPDDDPAQVETGQGALRGRARSADR